VQPDQAIASARAGKLRPVYLVLGEERWHTQRVVTALRDAATAGGVAGFNEDKFMAGEATAGGIVAASRMLPMMAPRRFVLVRGLERWEKKAADAEDADDAAEDDGKSARAASPLDELAEYAKAPVDSTVLVLVATKLHGSRKLVTLAKKGDFVVSCDACSRNALPGVVATLARERGHAIDEHVADLLAEIAGPELAPVADAVERLSLYVGPGAPITEDAVATAVTRVRHSTVWELVDAIAARRLDRALAVLDDVFDVRDGGLRLLGTVTWSVKQLTKFDSALAAGASTQEAAQRAGVPPFKVNDVQATVRRLPRGKVGSWLRLIADADLALKSSRRPAHAILEALIVDMCR
jgi:DNA polymerase-3 subunit delta